MKAFSAVERGIAPRPIFSGFAQFSPSLPSDALVSRAKLT